MNVEDFLSECLADARWVDPERPYTHIRGCDWFQEKRFGYEIATVRFPNTLRDSMGDVNSLELANRRFIEENFGEESWLIEYTYMGNGSEYGVDIQELLNSDDHSVPRYILNLINGLCDYPILDEEVMSEIEEDFWNESLEGYLVDDLYNEIYRRAIHTDKEDAIFNNEDAIREAIVGMLNDARMNDCHGSIYCDGYSWIVGKEAEKEIISSILARY